VTEQRTLSALKAYLEKNPWKILGFFAVLATLVIAIHPMLSPDAYMYVAIADYWIKHGVPTQDPFIIDPVKPFQIMHEWLGYFVFWVIHEIAGFDGVILMKAGLFAAMSAAVTIAAAKFRANWIAYAAALAAAMTSAHFRMSERTSIFSDLFELVVLTYALQLFIARKADVKRSALGFFVLFALWTNLHAGWLFGLALLAGAVGFTVVRDRSQWRLVFVVLAATLGLLVKPDGIYGVLYPFEFSQALRKLYSMYYVEWAPIYVDLLLNFIEVKVFLAFSAVASLAVLVMGFRRSIAEGLYVAALLLLLVGPTFMHSRFVVVSSFGLATLVCFAFRDSAAPRAMSVSIASAAAVATTLFFVVWPIAGQESPVKLGVDQTLMPTTALEELGRLPEGNVFNSHEFGGAIAWRYQGRYKVVFHGFDTDPARFLNDFFPAFENEQACLRAIAKYRIRYFFLDRHGSAASIWRMLEKHGWQIKTYDSAATLLIAPASSAP
jgi:hypothetical protein